MEQATSDLIKINSINAIEVFGQPEKLDEILKKIKDEALSFVPDLTTAGGRKEVASMAYKVSQSKTAIDNAGKELTAEWKKKSKAVDESRKAAREFLDNLRDQVRQPLTEWEEAEKARIEKERIEAEKKEAAIREKAEAFRTIASDCMGKDSKYIAGALEQLKSAEITEAEYEHMTERAIILRDKLVLHVEQMLSTAIDTERIAKEQAEVKAQQEAREAELKKQKEEQAEQLRIQQEAQEKQAAELAAKQAELDKQAAEVEAEKARIEAEAKAKAEKEAAEKQKAEAEKKRKAEEKAEKRRIAEENKAAKERYEVSKDESITKICKHVTQEVAVAIFNDIEAGNIPHVSFNA